MERAIELVKGFMQKLGVDPETGVFDIDRIETGTTTSQRNKMFLLLRIIEEMEKQYPEGAVPLQDLLAAAEDQGISDASILLDKLMKSGDIYEPRHGFVKRS